MNKVVFARILVGWEYLEEFSAELLKVATTMIAEFDTEVRVEKGKKGQETDALTSNVAESSKARPTKRQRTDSSSQTAVPNPNIRQPETPSRQRAFGDEITNEGDHGVKRPRTPSSPTKTKKRAKGENRPILRRRSLSPLSPERPALEPIITIRGRVVKPVIQK